MNKIFRRIGMALVGMAMAVGVGVSIGNSKTLFETKAADSLVTYTVTSKTSVSTSGTAPSGSSATFSQTYSNAAGQMTGGNSITLTLSGYSGYTITGLTISVKSNSSKGAGSLSFYTGGSTIASIADSTFNSNSWYGAWSTSYVDVSPTVTETAVAEKATVVLTISATANSLYFN